MGRLIAATRDLRDSAAKTFKYGTGAPLVCARGIEDDPTTVSLSTKACQGMIRTMSSMQIPIGFGSSTK
jgi:hypothetical protein